MNEKKEEEQDEEEEELKELGKAFKQFILELEHEAKKRTVKQEE